jgi:glycosyltransferase involved in cell wall biosynthesis
MNILFLSGWYPYPPDNGSKLRIYSLLRGLTQQHDVNLVTFSDQPLVNPSPELKALCTDVHIVPRRTYNPNSAHALLGFLSPTPRVIVDTYEPLMVRRILQELRTREYHLVIASEWRTAAYWKAFSGMPALLDDPEFGAFESKIAQASSFLPRLRHRLPLLKLRFYLRRLLPHFEACAVVSEAEGALLHRLVPGYNSIEVIPNCVNLADYRDVRATPEPDSLIFTGSFRYFANHDAMVWFLRKVYPLIQAQVPGVHLTITGDHANLPLPPADNVTLTGYVDDVRPLIASSWVSLAPIHLGGGTRLKILEAMALRTPVVATSKGAESLDVQRDEHLLIADTPEAFAEAVIRLLKEPGLCQRLTDNAYQLVCEKYDWLVVMPRFLNLVECVGGKRESWSKPRE